MVFIDSNNNSKLERGEQGLGGVVLALDNTKKITSDEAGQYFFRNISTGEHIIQVDLKTVPTKYIPQVPLKKQVKLKEGEIFFFNVPLKVSSIKK